MKKKHYTMSWDILKAVDVVEQYEQKHGKGQLPHAWLKRIYTGSLLDAVHFGRIPKRNFYGVAFKTLLEDDLGNKVHVDTSFKLDTATSLTELINGISDCKVRHKIIFVFAVIFLLLSNAFIVPSLFCECNKPNGFF